VNYFYAFKWQFKCLGINNIFFHNGYIVVWIIVITRYNWNINKSGVKPQHPFITRLARGYCLLFNQLGYVVLT
jgi:hypothetical protein